MNDVKKQVTLNQKTAFRKWCFRLANSKCLVSKKIISELFNAYFYRLTKRIMASA